MLHSLLSKFRAWRDRRHWQALHLGYIRSVIMTDWRWLSVHPAGKAITDRYEKITADDWYRHSLEDIDDFRRRIGWDPHAKVDLRARPRPERRPDASDGGIVYLERDDLAEVEAHSWVNDAYYSKVPTNTNVAYRPVDPPIDPDRPFQVVVSMDDAHWGVLVELAQKRGLSFSNLMVQALRVYQAEDRTGAIAASMERRWADL